MKKFLVKNSFHITTAVSIGILIYLIINWSVLPVMQRLVCFIFIAVTAHEWEEKLFGFEELNANNLNVSPDQIQEGVGYIALFLLTLYIGLMPLFFPKIIWLSATCMVLGLIELLAHIAAIRMNKSKSFYTPGMVTAFTILPLISFYGFYYLISNHLMQSSDWLFAFLNLFIPLICAQFISVKSMGVNYRDFLKNAFSSIKNK